MLKWFICIITISYSVFALANVPTPLPGAAQPQQYMPLLNNKRVGLVVNQTSVVGQQHLVDKLLADNVKVEAVFAPEHGFRGDHGAGAVVKDDKTKGIHVYSIYGKNKKPNPPMLANVDVLLFDIQDVGTRFYTYISTLHYVLEAAAEQGIPVVVLDRPNPNGAFVDGPLRQPGFASFVGLDPIPLLHGMTVGELALMIKGEAWINQADKLALTVIPVLHYNKTMRYSLPVPPSPNLPNDQAVQLYPSLCLFEATVMSVGRGTPYPFQVLGHNKVQLGDFAFTPISMPTSAPSPKLQDTALLGLDLRTSQVRGLQLTWLVRAHAAFKQAGLTLIDRPDFFDKLSGTDALRLAIESGLSEDEIRQSWQDDLNSFKQKRAPYLLYPSTPVTMR